MIYSYENKYGQLNIETIGLYQDVSLMKSKEFDFSCFFNIDEAEKIALITGNNGIQIAFCSWDRKKAYLVHHKSSSIVALCRIVSIVFNKDMDATKELARPTYGYIH